LSTRLHSTAPTAERTVLVGVELPKARIPLDESMEELARLADTAGLEVVARTSQALRRIHPATFIGAGKVTDVADLVRVWNGNVVVFDDALSPAQQRNLEKSIGCKVIDRSALILDIFAQRARSTEGKLQVELAQLQYLLPRLTKQWTHLSRLGGGVGTRGPGETQLEVDRRRVRERITLLRRRLEDVARTRKLHRNERTAAPIPTVALVGYTNAGKSTLMNALTQAGVLVEDRLFATLDPTVRRLRLPGGLTVALADTVGFIHKLPHQLVEAFKSTLEQVRTADLLLQVVDVSHPSWPEHRRIVEEVLAEIDADEVPALLVLNKSDRLPAGEAVPGREPHAPIVSARAGEGIPGLLAAMEDMLSRDLSRIRLEIPSGRGDLVAKLRRAGRVLEEYYRDGVVIVTALVPTKVAGQVTKALEARAGH
jgi:GTP-binding protein HflX